MQTDEGVTRCPRCNHQIRVDRRYVTWCDRCDWNVDPEPPPQQYPAWRHKLEHRLAETLHRELDRGSVRRPSLDTARICASVLSGLLLLLPLVAALAGIALLVFYRPLWFSAILALLAFSVAFLFRPRVHLLEPDAQLVDRDEAPRLYALLDEIAQAIGTRPVAAVAVDTEPNIQFGAVGWRFHPVLRLGLPLWTGLGPQERVAVLAHELGHGKNGDARHGWLLGTARSVLDELTSTFNEQPLDRFRLEAAYEMEVDPGFSVWVSKLVNGTVGRLARAYEWLLDRLVLRSDQRAEYLADLKAAEVAGASAAATALERSLLADAADRVMERELRFNKDKDPLDAVRRAVADVPAREIERQVRASRRRDARIDGTHPPTYLRINLVRAKQTPSARVVLGLDDNRTIDRELSSAAEAAMAELRMELSG